MTRVIIYANLKSEIFQQRAVCLLRTEFCSTYYYCVVVCLKKPFFLLFQAKIETKALKAKRPGFTDDRYHETEYYVENGKLYFIPSLFAGPFPLHFHSASSTINYALGVKKCTRKAPVRLLEWASQPRLWDIWPIGHLRYMTSEQLEKVPNMATRILWYF